MFSLIWRNYLMHYSPPSARSLEMAAKFPLTVSGLLIITLLVLASGDESVIEDDDECTVEVVEEDDEEEVVAEPVSRTRDQIYARSRQYIPTGHAGRLKRLYQIPPVKVGGITSHDK